MGHLRLPHLRKKSSFGHFSSSIAILKYCTSDEFTNYVQVIEALLKDRIEAFELSWKYIMLLEWNQNQTAVASIGDTFVPEKSLDLPMQAVDDSDVTLDPISFEFALTYDAGPKARLKNIEKSLENICRPVKFQLGNVRITSLEYEKGSVHQIEDGIWYTSFIIEADASVSDSVEVEPIINELMNTRMIAEKFFTQGPGTMMNYKNLKEEGDFSLLDVQLRMGIAPRVETQKVETNKAQRIAKKKEKKYQSQTWEENITSMFEDYFEFGFWSTQTPSTNAPIVSYSTTEAKTNYSSTDSKGVNTTKLTTVVTTTGPIFGPTNTSASTTTLASTSSTTSAVTSSMTTTTTSTITNTTSTTTTTTTSNTATSSTSTTGTTTSSTATDTTTSTTVSTVTSSTASATSTTAIPPISTFTSTISSTITSSTSSSSTSTKTTSTETTTTSTSAHQSTTRTTLTATTTKSTTSMTSTSTSTIIDSASSSTISTTSVTITKSDMITTMAETTSVTPKPKMGMLAMLRERYSKIIGKTTPTVTVTTLSTAATSTTSATSELTTSTNVETDKPRKLDSETRTFHEDRNSKPNVFLKSAATGQRTGLLSLLRNKYSHLATTATPTTDQPITTVTKSSILAKMRMKWKPSPFSLNENNAKISTLPETITSTVTSPSMSTSTTTTTATSTTTGPSTTSSTTTTSTTTTLTTTTSTSTTSTTTTTTTTTSTTTTTTTTTSSTTTSSTTTSSTTTTTSTKTMSTMTSTIAVTTTSNVKTSPVVIDYSENYIYEEESRHHTLVPGSCSILGSS